MYINTRSVKCVSREAQIRDLDRTSNKDCVKCVVGLCHSGLGYCKGSFGLPVGNGSALRRYRIHVQSDFEMYNGTMRNILLTQRTVPTVGRDIVTIEHAFYRSCVHNAVLLTLRWCNAAFCKQDICVSHYTVPYDHNDHTGG